ncbi:hypothetical protein J2Y45_004289 [Dyadobacter sp. BE34]|nr:hypothetical protein [Dyadobacter sp. BE34]MDR7217106.1 hypothetical protein [Dyadobacter sp. BE31]MDR7265039.1 hypothetical protein [Dyadobacter sp. BE32]
MQEARSDPGFFCFGINVFYCLMTLNVAFLPLASMWSR